MSAKIFLHPIGTLSGNNSQLSHRKISHRTHIKLRHDCLGNSQIVLLSLNILIKHVSQDISVTKNDPYLRLTSGIRVPMFCSLLVDETEDMRSKLDRVLGDLEAMKNERLVLFRSFYSSFDSDFNVSL